MKRKIVAMAARQKAEIVPEHYSFYPSIKQEYYPELIQCAKDTNTPELIHAMAVVLLKDIAADSDTSVPSEAVYDYYDGLYNKLQRSGMLSKEDSSAIAGSLDTI